MADGEAHHVSEIKDGVPQEAQLSPDVLVEQIPSGESRARYRVAWACSNLFRAGLLDRPQRAVYQLSETGRQLLPGVGSVLTEKHFEAQPKWQQYVAERKQAAAATGAVAVPTVAVKLPDEPEQDPENVAIAAIDKLNADLSVELLSRLRQGSPAFFEQAVLRVLLAMGYGGKDERALDALVRNSHTGQSGDGGIDGIIKQDPLGIQNIYIQAKRYQQGNTVGCPELQGFVGALHGKGVTRGVFITTSSYTKAAYAYALGEAKDRLVILAGVELTTLMLRYGVGVQSRRVLEVRGIDEDFFE